MYKGLRAVGGEAQRQGLFDLSVGINSTSPSGLVYRVNPTLRKCQDVTRLVCSVYRGFNHLAKVVVVGLVPTGTLFQCITSDQDSIGLWLKVVIDLKEIVSLLGRWTVSLSGKKASAKQHIF